MFKKTFRHSIRYNFLKDISTILFISTCVLSTVVAINEGRMLRSSLMTKGQSFASYIAKLGQDPLIMKDGIQLDSIVNEANKDEEILYTVIQDAEGTAVTSQFASINYLSPGLKGTLSSLSNESDFQDTIAAIKKNKSHAELSVPILSGNDTIGKVTIGMSQHNIRRQIVKSILFVIALNVIVALILGAVLFVASKKLVINPIAELAIGADRLAKGELSTQVTVKATGELQMLVESFNRMAGDLEKSTVSRKTLQTILDSMPYGIIIIDREKKIRTANRAALALMGYESENQIAGMICNKTLCPAEEGKCPILDLKQELDRSERRLITKEGKRINILKTVVALELGGEDVLLEAVVDITDRKHAEEQLKRYAEELREGNEDLQAFIYSAAHDLRSPVVNAGGFAKELTHILRKHRPLLDRCCAALNEDERTKLEKAFHADAPAAVGFINAAVVKMSMLIDAMLKLSRIDHLRFLQEKVDMDDLAQSLVSSMAGHIERQRASVTFGALPAVVADRASMTKIMESLLDNALKYLEAGRAGTVEITGERNNADAVFHVRDNGRGIAEDDMPKLFKMFRRLGKQDVPGEGMGLAYVKALVRRHGGRIWCESELGKGSTFSFTVPNKAERT